MKKTNSPDIVASESGSKKRILHAAAELFFSRGYERTTTLDIAQQANLSKRTLYQCFASKQEILNALIQGGAGRMRRESHFERPSSAKVFFETLRGFGRVFLEELFSEPKIAMYRLAIADATRTGVVSRDLDASGSTPVIASLLALFEMAGKDGLVHFPDTSQAVAIYFNLLIGEIQLKLIMGVGPDLTPELIAHRISLAVGTLQYLAVAKK